MSNSILIVAYHFPPIMMSSGYHRTLSFCKHLPAAGWSVSVLTVPIRAYSAIDENQYSLIPETTRVIRAFALDTARHLSFKQRYPKILALPDRWQSWILGGVITSLRHIRKQRPDVILSTYPIASAHVIGYLLARITGIPWISDFRDPMAQDDYPEDPFEWRCFDWIEKKAIKYSKKVILTTPGAVDFYRQKYPEQPESKWRLIPNGYDDEAFDVAACENSGICEESDAKNKIVLLHSGLLYPNERNPIPFFEALGALKKQGQISGETFLVILRASGYVADYSRHLKEMGIDDVVSLQSSIPYVSALKEMLTVDGLIIFQAKNCNYQIPAKAYEYLRSQKPVLVLSDPAGDTASLFASVGVGFTARLDSKIEIQQALIKFIRSIKMGSAKILSLNEVKKFSRECRSKELNEVLREIK